MLFMDLKRFFLKEVNFDFSLLRFNFIIFTNKRLGFSPNCMNIKIITIALLNTSMLCPLVNWNVKLK